MQATNSKLTEAIGATKLRKATKVIRDEKQWMAIFEAQRASGLTVEKFCVAHKISRSGYWKWNKLHCSKKEASAIKGNEPSFMPIPINVASASDLDLEFGTMRIRLDGSAAERVIEAIIHRINAPA